MKKLKEIDLLVKDTDIKKLNQQEKDSLRKLLILEKEASDKLKTQKRIQPKDIVKRLNQQCASRITKKQKRLEDAGTVHYSTVKNKNKTCK